MAALIWEEQPTAGRGKVSGEWQVGGVCWAGAPWCSGLWFKEPSPLRFKEWAGGGSHDTLGVVGRVLEPLADPAALGRENCAHRPPGLLLDSLVAPPTDKVQHCSTRFDSLSP